MLLGPNAARGTTAFSAFATAKYVSTYLSRPFTREVYQPPSPSAMRNGGLGAVKLSHEWPIRGPSHSVPSRKRHLETRSSVYLLRQISLWIGKVTGAREIFGGVGTLDRGSASTSRPARTHASPSERTPVIYSQR